MHGPSPTAAQDSPQRNSLPTGKKRKTEMEAFWRMGKDLDGQGASYHLPLTWPSGAIRTVVSTVRWHTVYNFSWRPTVGPIMLIPRNFWGYLCATLQDSPDLWEEATKTPEYCIFSLLGQSCAILSQCLVVPYGFFWVVTFISGLCYFFA